MNSWLNGRRWILVVLWLLGVTAVLATPHSTQAQQTGNISPISPMWGPGVQQWAFHIGVLAQAHGLDPDFIAAVISAESDGDHRATSQKGAVGLMGVMPTSPGMEWRPSADDLVNPAINLRWGVAILADVVQQAGGDLYAALAAYSGGWANVNNGVPRSYATSVLDSYARAVALRSHISPDVATQWTIAIKIQYGNIPNESLLVLGDQPISGLYTFGEHVVYHHVDSQGRAYHVLGYAVPVALLAPVENETVVYGDSESVDPYLRARLGDDAVLKQANSNPHVLLACLPSLDRLRGHASTRWFAPSDCPSWHR